MNVFLLRWFRNVISLADITEVSGGYFLESVMGSFELVARVLK